MRTCNYHLLWQDIDVRIIAKILPCLPPVKKKTCLDRGVGYMLLVMCMKIRLL